MGGRLQWNIFSWDEVGWHSGEQIWSTALIVLSTVGSSLCSSLYYIHLRYQEKSSPGDMFWIPAGAHSCQLGGVVEKACQVSQMETELENFQKTIMSNA